jgi:hypothetical protein
MKPTLLVCLINRRYTNGEPARRRRSQAGNCKNKNRLPWFFLQKVNDIGRLAGLFFDLQSLFANNYA